MVVDSKNTQHNKIKELSNWHIEIKDVEDGKKEINGKIVDLKKWICIVGQSKHSLIKTGVIKRALSEKLVQTDRSIYFLNNPCNIQKHNEILGNDLSNKFFNGFYKNWDEDIFLFLKNQNDIVLDKKEEDLKISHNKKELEITLDNKKIHKIKNMTSLLKSKKVPLKSMRQHFNKKENICELKLNIKNEELTKENKIKNEDENTKINGKKNIPFSDKFLDVFTKNKNEKIQKDLLKQSNDEFVSIMVHSNIDIKKDTKPRFSLKSAIMAVELDQNKMVENPVILEQKNPLNNIKEKRNSIKPPTIKENDLIIPETSHNHPKGIIKKRKITHGQKLKNFKNKK